MDDQEQVIASGLRAGKTEAWTMLYQQYASRVWGSVARRLGGESTEVADVVQEIFLAAARSARSYDPSRGSLWVWLSGIARNHVALHYRKRHRRPAEADEYPAAASQEALRWLEDRGDEPGDVVASVELAALVRDALAELPTDYEMLLSAKYLDGLSVEQIAEESRGSPVAIRSKLARARQAFREVFAKRFRSCPDSTGWPHES